MGILRVLGLVRCWGLQGLEQCAWQQGWLWGGQRKTCAVVRACKPPPATIPPPHPPPTCSTPLPTNRAGATTTRTTWCPSAWAAACTRTTRTGRAASATSATWCVHWGPPGPPCTLVNVRTLGLPVVMSHRAVLPLRCHAHLSHPLLLTSLPLHFTSPCLPNPGVH